MSKRVVITGGTEGIGKGIAANFLREGAKVLITSGSAEKGQNAVNELQNQDTTRRNNISFTVGDVSKPEELDAVLKVSKH